MASTSPPLDQIAAFIKVAELGSFTRAASALGVSPPVISKRVSSLEDQLGLVLLRRTTRSLHLTEEGRALAGSLDDLLDRVEEAMEQVMTATERVRGELSVVLPTYFVGPDIYQSVVPIFLRDNPKCELRLRVVDEPLNRLSESFDLLISGRLPERQLPDSHLIRRRLVRVPGAVYGCPNYLKRRGVPRKPADLAAHTCLNYLTRKWRFDSPSRRVEIIEPAGPISTNSNEVLREMTRQGMGLVYSLPAFFADDVASGAVREVLSDYTRHSYIEMNMFYPRQRRQPARTRAFIQLLQQQFANKRA